MIFVHVYTERNRIKEFHVTGHAGFADAGQDIVCAAVSILVYNTINSCERFAHTILNVSDFPDKLICQVPDKLSERAEVLLKSLFFGIEQLEEQYGEFVQLKFYA